MKKHGVRSGWFNDNWQHGLAAKGIKVRPQKYFLVREAVKFAEKERQRKATAVSPTEAAMRVGLATKTAERVTGKEIPREEIKKQVEEAKAQVQEEREKIRRSKISASLIAQKALAREKREQKAAERRERMQDIDRMREVAQEAKAGPVRTRRKVATQLGLSPEAFESAAQGVGGISGRERMLSSIVLPPEEKRPELIVKLRNIMDSGATRDEKIFAGKVLQAVQEGKVPRPKKSAKERKKTEKKEPQSSSRGREDIEKDIQELLKSVEGSRRESKASESQASKSPEFSTISTFIQKNPDLSKEEKKEVETNLAFIVKTKKSREKVKKLAKKAQLSKKGPKKKKEIEARKEASDFLLRRLKELGVKK